MYPNRNVEKYKSGLRDKIGRIREQDGKTGRRRRMSQDVREGRRSH